MCVAQQPGRGAPANLCGAARGIEFAAFCRVDHHVWRSRPRAVRAREALSPFLSLYLSLSDGMQSYGRMATSGLCKRSRVRDWRQSPVHKLSERLAACAHAQAVCEGRAAGRHTRPTHVCNVRWTAASSRLWTFKSVRYPVLTVETVFFKKNVTNPIANLKKWLRLPA